MRKAVVFSIFFSLLFLASSAASPREHFRQGMQLYRRGMWGAAEQQFLQARGRPSLELECRAMIALCASAAYRPEAGRLLEDFLEEYPHSIYRDAIRFALADRSYRSEEWSAALEGFRQVDMRRLPSGQRDQYRFKTGYCYFRTGQYSQAYEMFGQVDPATPYTPSATYYRAYIDYTAGRYAAAKQGFRALESDASYGQLVPFYLLQIEFQEGNYAYVTERGERLIPSATPSRAREIAYAMAESWYRLRNHDQALRYIERFRALGGAMGRQENYIEGYCYYMLGRYDRAAEALGLACGPDDALAQNASYHLADCYLKLGERQRAMYSFSIAAAGHYDPAIAEDALFNYGKLQYDLGAGVFNEAINSLTRYVATYPDSPRVASAREYLLAAYYNSRNYQAAYEAIRQIPDPDNNVRAALQKITYFHALECYNAGELVEADRLLAISAANRYNAKYSALTSYWRAEVAYASGNYAAAVPLYADYIRLSPRGEREHAAAHYALAYSYFEQKQWLSAREGFTRFLALASSAQLGNAFRADASNRIGDIYLTERNYWGAIGQYDNAIRIGGQEQYYAAWQRALALGLAGREAGKIETLQQIIESNQGNYVDEALVELGRTRFSQQLFAEANELFNRYLRDYPAGAERIEVLADQALVAQNMGYSDRALNYYKQVVAAAPGTSAARDALMGIRAIYIEQNNVQAYFDYAAQSGMESDLGTLERDSITFAAAERLYLAGDAGRAAPALESYLGSYPRGAYRLQANFYLADCALRTGARDQAKRAYTQLIAPPDNAYTARSLEPLARMQEEDLEYAAALDTYRRLSRIATSPTPINRALEGMLRTAGQIEGADVQAVARQVLATPQIDEAVTRKARFALADALLAAGSADEATQIFASLSAETQSVEGARSAYYMIEQCVATGKADEAKQRIFTFSEQRSPHEYWLGRAFLVLGDIYAAQGDAFQARATFQSIVDGYSMADDGIIEQAKGRIANL